MNTTQSVDAVASPLLYRPEEVADLLGCSRVTVYGLLDRRELDSVKIGRLRRIPRSAVEAYVAGLAHTAGVRP